MVTYVAVISLDLVTNSLYLEGFLTLKIHSLW